MKTAMRTRRTWARITVASVECSTVHRDHRHTSHHYAITASDVTGFTDEY